MKSISESELREFAKEMLFENQISERYGPDDFTNSRTTMFDRPGPQVNSSNSELSYKEEIEIKIPITSDDMMTNTAYSFKNKNVFDNNYAPQNSQELGHAILSAIDIKEDDLQSDHIQNVWSTLKKVLDKV